jgi:hypothetical protein
MNLLKVEEYLHGEVSCPSEYDSDRELHREIVEIWDSVDSGPTQDFEQRDNQLTYSL